MWYYRPFKVITEYFDKGKVKTTTHWEVREYYPKSDVIDEMWTESAIEPIGDTRKGLIKTLEMMLEDVKHYKPKVERRKLKQ